jgi:hypothetical protein
MTLETDLPTSSGLVVIQPAAKTVPTKKGKEVMVNTKIANPNTTRETTEE